MHSNEFKDLVILHQNRLFRLAYWMLQNREDAEDLVQEVFAKLWKMKTELPKYNSVEALLITITRNMCLNRIKKKKLMQVDEPTESVRSPILNPHDKLEYKEDQRLVSNAILQLPELQKVILHLKSVEGLEIKEIAQLVGESENHVRVTLSRARKKVREIVQNHFNYGKTSVRSTA